MTSRRSALLRAKDGPLFTPGLALCGESDDVLAPDARLVVELPLDCDDAGTLGPFPFTDKPRLYATRTIDVQRAGQYVVWTDAYRVELSSCEAADEPLEAAYRGSIDAELDSPYSLSRFFVRYDLQPGMYLAWVVAPDMEPGTVKLVMQPNLAISRVALVE